MKLSPTQIEALQQEFSYCPSTGAIKRGNRVIQSYQTLVHIDGKAFKATRGRLAYLLNTGKDIPASGIIKYRDNNSKNTQWANIELSTYAKRKRAPFTPRKPLLDHLEFLQSCFHYNPDTGQLTWKERPDHHFKRPQDAKAWNTRHKGKPAGTPQAKNGRLQIYIKGKTNLHVYASSVAWVLFTRSDVPDGLVIDFKNRVPDDNRIANLRLATRGEDMLNAIRPIGRSGVRGVTEHENGTFQAWIRIKRKDLKVSESKSFDSLQAATAWRHAKEIQYFGEFAPHAI
ncbi:HNH endonuclease [Paraburkholderia oxyphila]|uniref:HNH endonuclease n=1 Tax=Paraburkholderia oxyphila TaxID=614212 RepID=UPI000693C9BA|nr:HNH endonuclease [Paraburkholderia oxyphila]